MRLSHLSSVFANAMPIGSGRHSALLRSCESVMEQAFAAAFIINDAFKITPAGIKWRIERGEDCLVLEPQYEVRQVRDPWASGVDPERIIARADFAFWLGEDIALLVEVDGHEYHERSREQVMSDRSRDRKMMRCGLPVARFTGTEINREPKACTVEAFALALELGRLK